MRSVPARSRHPVGLADAAEILVSKAMGKASPQNLDDGCSSRCASGQDCSKTPSQGGNAVRSEFVRCMHCTAQLFDPAARIRLAANGLAACEGRRASLGNGLLRSRQCRALPVTASKYSQT